MELWNAFKELDSGCAYHVGLYYAEEDADDVYPFETLLDQSFGLHCFLKSRDSLRCGFSDTEFEVIHRCFTESKAAVLIASHNLLKDPMLKLVAHALYEQQRLRPRFSVIIAALDDVVLPRSLYLGCYPRLNLYEGSVRVLCKIIWCLIGGAVGRSRLVVVDPCCFGDVVKAAGIWWKEKTTSSASVQLLDRVAADILAPLCLGTTVERGCRLCHAGVVDALRHIHTAVCAAVVVGCPNDGCAVQETRHLLSLHVRHCPYGMLRCPDCAQPVLRKDLGKHKSCCLATMVNRRKGSAGDQHAAGSLWELVGSNEPVEDNVKAIIQQWHRRSCIAESRTPVESLDALADSGLTSYPIKELLKLLVLSGDMSVETYNELARHAATYREAHPSRSDNLAYLSSLRSLCPTMWSAVVRSDEDSSVMGATRVLQSLKPKPLLRPSEQQSSDQVMQILMMPRRGR